jgi:hypothetical protein
MSNKKQDLHLKKVILSSLLLSLLCPEDVIAGPATCNTKSISMSAVVTTLDFATATPCVATAGTLTLDAGKVTITTTGCIQNTAGTPAVASVKVTTNQAAGVKVQVKVTTASINITRTAGTPTMSVVTFDLSLKGGGPTVTLVGNTAKTIPIGASLKVGANQSAGTYKGAFSVTAKCI